MAPALTDPFHIGPRPRSPTASSSRRSRGSATGSCACRPSATAPASPCRRWSRASRVHYGNEKTCVEMLRIHPDERAGTAGRCRSSSSARTPRSCAPRPRRSPSAAPTSSTSTWAARCPKVCKTGAGAALIKDPDTAVARRARRARGQRPAGHREAALRASARARPTATRSPTASSHEAGVAAIGFHPRSAAVHHKGVAGLRRSPRELVASARRARDPHRRAVRPRRRPGRLRAHRRRRGHARPRLARQPVAVRAAPGRARRAEPTRGRGPRRARLGHGPRRRAPRPGARGALPAPVLPLVPGPDSAPGRRCSRPSSRRPRWTRRGPCWRASGACRAAA